MNKLLWTSTFALLSAGGFYFLWVLIMKSPAFTAFRDKCPINYFPVSNASRASTAHQVYTGNRIIDWNLCGLTSFFVEAMKPEGYDTTFSVLLGLPPIAIYLLGECMRAKPSNAIVPAISPVILGLAFQRLGMGFILPLSFMFVVNFRQHGMETKQISGRHALAILIAMITTYYIPTYYVLTTADPRIIAFWQPLPLYIAIVQFIVHLVLPNFSSPSGSRILQGAYVLTLLIAIPSHLSLLWSVRDDFIGGFARIFIPSPYPIQGDSLPMVAKNFFQWDNVFICGTVALFALHFAETTFHLIGMLLTYTLVSILVGPGSAVGLVLLWREMRVSHARSEAQTSKRK